MTPRAKLLTMNRTLLTILAATLAASACGQITISNAVLSGVSGNNGSGLTNLNASELKSGTVPLAALPLQKMKIFGGLANVTIPTGAYNCCPFSTIYSASPSASTRVFNSILPIGGYFTNLEVYSYATWPSTTNIVFTIGTNSGLAGIVGTALTCTLSPNGSNVYTNSGTASYTLPSSRSATGDVVEMMLNTTSPGGSLSSQYITWSLDYYYPPN